ncbi:MAG: radical SAM protein [Bacteroidota bacterium]
MCLVTFSWENPDSLKKVKEFRLKNQVTWAHIELTDVCNFNCEWCYTEVDPDKKTYMSLETIEKLIMVLANSGVKQITYAGGEPLMYPYIKEAVELAYKNGMIVHINSNGYFLTKHLARELKKRGLSQIQLNISSLDAQLHDRIHGKAGAFYHVMKAMRNAEDAGITRVVQTVLTKQNENKIYDIMKFVRERFDVERCRVWDATPSGTALGKYDLYPSNYPKTLEKITEFAAKLGAKHVLSYEPLFPINYNSPIDITHLPCPSSDGILAHIFADTNVYFCSTLRDEPLYNVLDYDNISDVHKTKIKEFKKNFYTSSNCHLCKYSKICNMGCPTRSKINNNEIDYQCHI